MIYLIIAVLLFTGYMIYEADGFGEKVSMGMSGFILGALSGLAIWMALGTAVGIFLPERVELQTHQIVALQDNIGVEGSFFLGSGTIDSEPHYTYMIETERGFKLESVEADEAYIIYDDNPRIQTKYKSLKYDWMYLIAIKWSSAEYTFYIPEGSIYTGYKVDLQ